jgi:hypothetical protein
LKYFGFVFEQYKQCTGMFRKRELWKLRSVDLLF